jgi:uncharacterized membrane protein SpoIIM required for sporulation
MLPACTTSSVPFIFVLVTIWTVAICATVFALVVFGPELLRELRIAYRRHRFESYALDRREVR